MDKILLALDGNKAKIMAVIGVIVGVLSTMGVISPTISTAIMSILSIVAGGTAVVTDARFGKAVRNK